MSRLVLITGSSGHLGEALVTHWRGLGRPVRGLDIKPSPCTDQIGSIADPATANAAMAGVGLVIHTATLHKPHVATHTRQDFIDTNVTGTLNLLEAAVQHQVDAFVFTSTTSVFGDALIPPAGAPAAWITEAITPVPKNIYGVTKNAAEDLCQLFHRNHRLPAVVLRTSRFFPEADDDPKSRADFDDNNLKVCEFLHRRVAIEDVVQAHILAAERAAQIGFDRLIITASTPFQIEDLDSIRLDPWRALEQRLPGTRAAFEALRWRMLDQIDRVYVNARARERLGWRPVDDFACVLARALQGQSWQRELAQHIGRKGYHDQIFSKGPFPVE